MLFLLIAHALVVFGLLEEAFTSQYEIILADTPLFLEEVEDATLMVENFNGTFLSDILESNDTIRDATTLEDADPSDLRSVVSMGTTAGFSVYSSNVYYSERVSRYYTTLVKSVAVLLLSFSLVHE